ncbi:hypothetical protein CPAST_c40610 [Clostridium pasteurianum DSM 525 = ATCC 6013]|uniref:Uncharacterized protein n=1 Tax=Clostridium pasteurianum DSM 525 = ATCC 6013 TaxID=1262449 RepID=A0A0H3JBP5_CLOPA|nr:hypothetical protein [Clostridium pasteurianum]AJA50090.1 hypothetical protein CPAST_c40610 [Clostridium pasteurianum DSM 525 = ATCC 6013]AJA54078.1 hypothetical protein CLPA_c40610 [Clostridium pasteurianum DSM 525 = ATCC 6013]KRU10738.1 hypothetical protein CP6013_04030 [Clostridium pasteurianum DSM 525 = ATCC 6013]KRU13897.1 hypothetical protein CP6013_03153 [Clostridium pasteurianum DSM 525 = ATCC 6013]
MKYEVGEVITLGAAMVFNDDGLALVVTDGRYVEPSLDEED